MVDVRLAALDRLEKALITAMRASDPEIVHEVCVLAWSLALPALQPNIRKHAKRVLQSCAKALEDIFSPLHVSLFLSFSLSLFLVLCLSRVLCCRLPPGTVF